MSRSSASFRLGLPALGLLTGLLLGASGPGGHLAAQVHIGGQFTLGSDSRSGLGARFVFPLRPEALALDGVLDANHFLSPGGGLNRWNEMNVNARVPLPVSDRFVSRVGAGLNLAFVSADPPPGQSDDTRTRAGLNLLGAVEFSRGPWSRGRVIPFAEARLVVGGMNQVVVSAGVTLGSPRGAGG